MHAKPCKANVYRWDVPETEVSDMSAKTIKIVLLAIVLLFLVGVVAFWPALRQMMTPFRYGFVVGFVSAWISVIGGFLVAVCCGAGRLEDRGR